MATIIKLKSFEQEMALCSSPVMCMIEGEEHITLEVPLPLGNDHGVSVAPAHGAVVSARRPTARREGEVSSLVTFRVEEVESMRFGDCENDPESVIREMLEIRKDAFCEGDVLYSSQGGFEFTVNEVLEDDLAQVTVTNDGRSLVLDLSKMDWIRR